MLNRHSSVLIAAVALLISNSTYSATVVPEFNPYIAYDAFYKPANTSLFAGFYSVDKVSNQKKGFNQEEHEFQITTVPVPAAAWLFVSGVLGLLTVSRRKKEHVKG